MRLEETRQKSFGHVLICDIDDDLSSVVALRKNDKWFYVSVDPEDIENDHIRGQYERRASACKRQQDAYLKLCNDEDGGQNQDADKETSDSGYSSEEPASTDEDAENVFREWVQASLTDIFDKHAPPQKRCEQYTLQDWYTTDIFCYSLTASEGDNQLQAVERKDLDSDAYLNSTIIPNMSVPKYISALKNTNWYKPADVQVLAESHDIHMPLHPTIVRVRTGEGDDEYKDCFLKLCAEFQEPAVKREIKLLADFKKKDLYSQGVRAPRLEGIVTLPSSPTSHTKILGFLLSLIPQPSRPLTKLMTSEIPASKRKAWSVEVKKQVEILHKNDLLWGDAKADNFLVDRDDNLWIIDFGGSYTVGWMDGRTYGTRKGEQKVVDLIVKGVKDPDHCPDIDGLLGDTDEREPSQSEEARKARADEKKRDAKRKSSSQTDDTKSEEPAAKRRK